VRLAVGCGCVLVATTIGSLRRFGVEPSALADAAQHVFLVLATNAEPPPPEKERSFLVGSCIRIAANSRRSQKRSREVLEPVEHTLVDARTPEQLLDWKQRRQALDRALDSLTLDQRGVFVLYELEGFSLPEIAESLDLPLGTATSRLKRARAAFEAFVAQNQVGVEE
jgi:RNA polymerase sigma-70 factor (ECF subfamily)